MARCITWLYHMLRELGPATSCLARRAATQSKAGAYHRVDRLPTLVLNTQPSALRRLARLRIRKVGGCSLRHPKEIGQIYQLSWALRQRILLDQPHLLSSRMPRI